jgi:hypothetical protein
VGITVNREERAKQFMAFDALKGLREELKKREEKYLKEKKRELTEEKIMELSKKLAVLSKGDVAEITFYHAGHYVVLKGVIQSVNTAYKYLGINDTRISFEDLAEIEIE